MFQNYQYRDKDIALQSSNVVYYRLKETDKDGTYSYSPVKMLRVNNNETISVAPNPFSSYLRLTVTSHSAQTARIIMGDINGSIIVTEKRSLVEGNNVIQYNTASLTRGTYIVKVKFDDGTITSTRAVKN